MKKAILSFFLAIFAISLMTTAAFAVGDKNHGEVGAGSVNQDWKCIQLDGICPLDD